MNQSAEFRPYIVEEDASLASNAPEILSGRNKALAAQLADHNRRVLWLNGDAKAVPVDAVSELSYNTCSVIEILTSAERRLIGSLDDDPRLAGVALPPNFAGSRGRYARCLVQKTVILNQADGKDEQAADVAAEWEVIKAGVGTGEAEAVQAIFGDRHVWRRIHQASNESRGSDEFVGSVSTLLDSASSAGKRPIHSAADGLLYVWVHISGNRPARHRLIEELSSTEATGHLLERHFVRPLSYPYQRELLLKGGILWLPGTQAQYEDGDPSVQLSVPPALGKAALHVIHLNELGS